MSNNKIRVVVQNPYFIFNEQQKNFNGYNFKFVEKYCDSILLYRSPLDYLKYRRRLKELGWNKKIYLLPSKACSDSDALVCFNGCAYMRINQPPKAYKKNKFFHVMDFTDSISKSSENLSSANYLLGYCQHDRFSPFFRKYYNNFQDRVIAVPFGYGCRFVNEVPIENRINKCIALGAVNPVDDPLMSGDSLKEYRDFYSSHTYSHEIRKAIVDNIDKWGDCFDSRLPVFPETKNSKYDAVEELNRYTMFINDASLDQYPPARTYEGIACGCVMVAEDLDVYKTLGFINGKNCILFPKGNYDCMLSKIKYFMAHLEELKLIQKESIKLSLNFTHEKIADNLYLDICSKL